MTKQDDSRKPITLSELADIYDREHPNAPQPARTLPPGQVLEWAEIRADLFVLGDDGYLYHRAWERYSAGEWR